jgi:hypothetical protein
LSDGKRFCRSAVVAAPSSVSIAWQQAAFIKMVIPTILQLFPFKFVLDEVLSIIENATKVNDTKHKARKRNC